MKNLTKKQLNNLAKVFKKYNVVFAYLFGSQATGKTNQASDFDIAVMLPEKYDSSKRFKIRLKIMSEVGRAVGYPDKVDLVVLNDTKLILFKFVIIREGKVIYENNHLKRVNFELKTMNNYYDFSPFIEAYNKAYLKRILADV